MPAMKESIMKTKAMYVTLFFTLQTAYTLTEDPVDSDHILLYSSTEMPCNENISHTQTSESTTSRSSEYECNTKSEYDLICHNNNEIASEKSVSFRPRCRTRPNSDDDNLHRIDRSSLAFMIDEEIIARTNMAAKTSSVSKIKKEKLYC